jgi:RNA polymerase sigma-70 factor (ECF subfamily)
MVRREVTVPPLAGELVQDVFVAAWVSAPGYREERGDPEQWLLGITRHKLQDHCRRVRAVATAIGAPTSRGLKARVPDTDARLVVEKWLVALPTEQRRVLDLIYQSGLTFAEIACALGVPPGAVKSRMDAALLSLRGLFDRSERP